MSRQRLISQQWREVIQGQRASGLSVQTVCQREGLAVSMFFAWQQRLRQDPPPWNRRNDARPRRGLGFVEVTVKAREAEQAGDGESAASPVELVLHSLFITHRSKFRARSSRAA